MDNYTPARGNANQTNVFYVHRSGDGRLRYTEVYDSIVYMLRALGYSNLAAHRAALTAGTSAIAAEAPEERGSASYSSLQNAWFEALRAQALIPPAEMPYNEDGNRPLVPHEVPDLSASPAEASRQSMRLLLPSLSNMLHSVADSIQRAEPRRFLTTDGSAEANELIEQLGALGSTLASTTALITSLVAPNSQLEESMVHGGGVSTREEAQPNHGRDGSSSMTNHDISRRPEQHDERSGSALENAQSSADAQGGSTMPQVGSEPSSAVLRRAGSAEVPQSRGPRRIMHEGFGVAIIQEEMRIGNEAVHGDSEAREHRNPADQEANADFIMRILVYYLLSLPDPTNDQEPSTFDEQSADSVLDGVYGGQRRRPSNWSLQMLQRVMRTMTSHDFRSIVGGNFGPLNSLSFDLCLFFGQQLSLSHSSNLTLDVTKALVEMICYALHNFSHDLEEAHNSFLTWEDENRLEGLCSQLMPVLQPQAIIIANLLASQFENESFGDSLLDTLIIMWGEAATVCNDVFNLGGDWDKLFQILRRAANGIGVRLLGERFAMILPLIIELFSTRGKEALRLYQLVVAQISSEDTEQGHLNSHRATHSIQTMNNQAEEEDRRENGNEGDEHGDASNMNGEDDSEGVREDQAVDRNFNPQDMYMYGEEDQNGTHEDTGHNGGRVLPSASHKFNRDIENTRVVELDDNEIDEMVAELKADCPMSSEPLDSMYVGMDNDVEDFEEMARELENEQTGNASPQASSSTNTAERTKPAVVNGRPMRGIPSMLSSAMGTPGLAAGLADPRASNSASIQHSPFSTATTPSRLMFSSISAKNRDEFDNVLGSHRGAKWRRVVREDEAKMTSAIRGPLSRGYKNEKSDLLPFTVESAIEMGLEDARTAAREAQLPYSVVQDLKEAIRNNGPLYLHEFERAVHSRLSTDPDFDESKYPSAAKRFGLLG